MKVEEVNNGFKPIEIKLTIESEQELCNLWLRASLSVEEVNEHHKGHKKTKLPCNEAYDKFFQILEDSIDRLNLIQ